VNGQPVARLQHGSLKTEKKPAAPRVSDGADMQKHTRRERGPAVTTNSIINHHKQGHYCRGVS